VSTAAPAQLQVWRSERIDYLRALRAQRHYTDTRGAASPDVLWWLEHDAVFTQGQAGKPEHLLDPGPVPVLQSDRGGQVTWHGPGQLVGYVLLDLRRRGGDVRAFVRALEGWIIATLGDFGVAGERREGRVGIWVDRGAHLLGGRREDKIAAIGVRIRHWVSFHGLALNVSCDLRHYAGIVPCGISDTRYGVTSLLALGRESRMAQVDAALRRHFDAAFPAPSPDPTG
jgi:lipoyl(octanoyl) transferase